MNHEIIKVLTAKEYLEVFLNKNLRIDRRDLKEKRPISYNFGILDTFSTSASCSIGENNKIIAVLKSSNNTEGDKDTLKKIDLVVENFTDTPITNKSSFSEPNLLHFINKLIDDNLEFELPCEMKFSLHITIVSSDGNIYDCISYLISELFNGKKTKENECGLNRYLKLKRNFISNTFCVIDEKLLADPTPEELKCSNYYFTVLKFDDDDYLIHKIKGDSINWNLIEEAIQSS